MRDVAARLNVSTATVHRLIDVRDLGHIRIGRRTIRVPESALVNYLERCTVRGLR
ncbi:helix-turn-helix domain-containing protein [Euzebya sp.]|uniref:helix-turn-helix domain-containing protein n=1 Tax=Euzebya sp. TaxID=1971409 RepID=UPI0035146A97